MDPIIYTDGASLVEAFRRQGFDAAGCGREVDAQIARMSGIPAEDEVWRDAGRMLSPIDEQAKVMEELAGIYCNMADSYRALAALIRAKRGQHPTTLM